MRNIYLRFKCTEKCNLDCSFCHNEGIMIKNKTEMKLSFFKRIINILKEIGLVRIKFTGGEPTECDKLKEYLKICSNLAIENIGVVSNGIQKKVVGDILKYHKNVDFTISIPSFDDFIYNKLTKGKLKDNFINYASEEQLKNITINHILLTENITDEWFDSILFYSKKVKKIKLLIPCNVSSSDVNFKSYSILDAIEKFLEKKGFFQIKKETNHIYYSNGSISNIVVTPPYCPIICSQVDSLTLRLTANGILKPCFIENTENRILTESMTDEEIKENILSLSQTFSCPYSGKKENCK